MNAAQEYVTPVETAWSYMLPDFSVPSIKIVLGWRKWYSIETVLAAIEDIAGFVNRKGPEGFDSDSVGRIVSSRARKMQAQRLEANPAYEQPFPERT